MKKNSAMMIESTKDFQKFLVQAHNKPGTLNNCDSLELHGFKITDDILNSIIIIVNDNPGITSVRFINPLNDSVGISDATAKQLIDNLTLCLFDGAVHCEGLNLILQRNQTIYDIKNATEDEPLANPVIPMFTAQCVRIFDDTDRLKKVITGDITVHPIDLTHFARGPYQFWTFCLDCVVKMRGINIKIETNSMKKDFYTGQNIANPDTLTLISNYPTFLSNMLGVFKNIDELDLSKYNLTSEQDNKSILYMGISALFQRLSEVRAHTINLTRCHLPLELLQAMAKCGSIPGLKQLYLSDNDSVISNLTVITQILKKNKNIQELSLSLADNSETQAVQNFFVSIKDTTINSLTISKTTITTDVAKTIADFLDTNGTLQELLFLECKIDEEANKILQEKINQELQSGSKIHRVEGLKDIPEDDKKRLAKNKKLNIPAIEKVTINQCDAEVLNHIVRNINTYKIIKELTLHDCSFDDDDSIEHLLRILKFGRIQKLYFTGKMSDELQEAIRDKIMSSLDLISTWNNIYWLMEINGIGDFDNKPILQRNRAVNGEYTEEHLTLQHMTIEGLAILNDNLKQNKNSIVKKYSSVKAITISDLRIDNIGVTIAYKEALDNFLSILEKSNISKIIFQDEEGFNFCFDLFQRSVGTKLTKEPPIKVVPTIKTVHRFIFPDDSKLDSAQYNNILPLCLDPGIFMVFDNVEVIPQLNAIMDQNRIIYEATNGFRRPAAGETWDIDFSGQTTLGIRLHFVFQKLWEIFPYNPKNNKYKAGTLNLSNTGITESELKTLAECTIPFHTVDLSNNPNLNTTRGYNQPHKQSNKGLLHLANFLNTNAALCKQGWANNTPTVATLNLSNTGITGNGIIEFINKLDDPAAQALTTLMIAHNHLTNTQSIDIIKLIDKKLTNLKSLDLAGLNITNNDFIAYFLKIRNDIKIKGVEPAEKMHNAIKLKEQFAELAHIEEPSKLETKWNDCAELEYSLHGNIECLLDYIPQENREKFSKPFYALKRKEQDAAKKEQKKKNEQNKKTIKEEKERLRKEKIQQEKLQKEEKKKNEDAELLRRQQEEEKTQQQKIHDMIKEHIGAHTENNEQPKNNVEKPILIINKPEDGGIKPWLIGMIVGSVILPVTGAAVTVASYQILKLNYEHQVLGILDRLSKISPERLQLATTFVVLAAVLVGAGIGFKIGCNIEASNSKPAEPERTL